MTLKTLDPSQRKTVRTAGLLYLLTGLPAAFSMMYVHKTLVVAGDAAATAENILSSEMLFRFGIVAEVISYTAFIFLVRALYRLFREVNKEVASLMVGFVLISVAIAFVNLLSDIAALRLLTGSAYASMFPKAELEALAYLFVDLTGQGYKVNSIFWGLWLFPFGMLAMRSGFIPRWIGGWLIVNGFAYVVSSLTWLLVPAYGSLVFNYSMPALVGELWIMVWLLYRGFAPAKSR